MSHPINCEKKKHLLFIVWVFYSGPSNKIHLSKQFDLQGKMGGVEAALLYFNLIFS
jgi:hypothetical protein